MSKYLYPIPFNQKTKEDCRLLAISMIIPIVSSIIGILTLVFAYVERKEKKQ